ncbi:hypothetical protein ACLH0K_13555 [Arthrobacter sp. MPF02]|uniref:hypothetical protein n=1 Tax=Arthrobacter sp. MPF02 TaxID=3388492 RepID=UPI0039855E07
MANAAHAARKTQTTRRPLTATGLSALSLAAVLTVSGCSLPGIPGPTGAPGPAPAVEQAAEQAAGQVAEQVAAVTPVPDTDAQAVPEPESVAPEPVRAIHNDLADGSTSRSLGAAGNHLLVDYWTTENPVLWTPESSPIIQVNAKVAGSAVDRTIKITRFNARVDALSAVLANDTGDFAIGDPHSYSSAVVVPGNPGAETTRIVFTFDLLTETEPGSGVFTRQTVMDALTIGYAATAAPAAQQK